MVTSPPLEGFDIDLASAIATDLGLTAEFVYFGYDGLYDALQTEQVDVLISALVIQAGTDPRPSPTADALLQRRANPHRSLKAPIT